MRFHILGIPHTISTPEYSTCAFTQKVVRLCAMLHRAGHEVFHYGHEDSRVECTHHMICADRKGHEIAYGNWDWRKQGFPPYDVNDGVYRSFHSVANMYLSIMKKPGDFLLCPFGYGHKPVADAHPDMIVVESGIGYGGGFFAPYKVFESYALLHTYLGLDGVNTPFNSHWYDVVIPNYYDTSEFKFLDVKEDYLLFIGRLNEGKGLNIAEQVAEATGHKLIVAGQGEYRGKHEYVGVVNQAQRRELLARAKGVLCPSAYVEPFCGVQIEAFLSGTPVISTDWGAFTEYNLHGVTGWRCRTFAQFIAAVERLGEIYPADCRAHGLEFSIEAVYPRYEEFFKDVQNVHSGKGWYA